MQEATLTPTPSSDSSEELAAQAARAGAWFGEPFLHPGEDASAALAPGTARRAALDDALAEMAQGRREPSSRWKVRYGLMLGLERVLASETTTTAGGTELRRHQIDALAGMLTELIAATQRSADENGNGANGAALATEGDEAAEELEDDDDLDAGFVDEDAAAAEEHGDDPGAARRYRFRHPTASGKTIAAAGFVDAARHLGVLILTHRRLLVSQFQRDLTAEGYGDRLVPAVEGAAAPPRQDPITIQTYAWFARHGGELSRDAYQLVICDEAHTALGEKTSAAIRAFSEPLYIGMTATEQLIAKQVSDVFPASVDDLPLADAARRGLIAPLRCLRVPPVAAINSVPIVGGDFEERALAAALDHQALNQAAASLYRDRFGSTPGIVYAAGVAHAYNLAQEFRAVGLRATAVSGRTPPRELAETLAAYERGEINVLVNAQLLAEGWNSPRATVCFHLAPTASRRVYQQRIGRIMRMHPRKEAGIVVDFVPKAATHAERVVSLHSLLDADFYREGARVTPAPRRRSQRRARRKLSPAPWLVPVTPDVRRRLAVIQREWQRVDPKFLDDDEQRFWATIAGRQIRFDQRAEFARKFAEGRAGRSALETFLSTCAAENPNRRLRMTALADRVGMTVERADFDDLVTLVTQAPPWEKDRAAGVRILLRAIGEGRANAPDQILARWTWRLARAVRKTLDRKASQEFPEAKRLLGSVANSRGQRHEENVRQLVRISAGLPTQVAAALLASAEGYTPRANAVLEQAREDLGPI
jgi:superfamily II DNA or RNA helicase